MYLVCVLYTCAVYASMNIYVYCVYVHVTGLVKTNECPNTRLSMRTNPVYWIVQYSRVKMRVLNQVSCKSYMLKPDPDPDW